ncbi:MAG: alanine--glyoxylate aminotransferase family protein [Clostridia bacterium]|nr:alanine--glyoxylate aminotransferase family protein [Clostridia bacterium]
MKPLIMTPGPTYIHEDVRKALASEIINPDLDLNFYEFYKDTCTMLQKILNTVSDVLILSGEGILGLEAACCSIIEPGDRVLCIDNGIFGNGFGDFAKMYGAEVVYFKSDYRKAIDVKALEDFLNSDSAFKMATVVHCETPSGITNPVNEICPLLKRFGILTVVDSVSAIGGEEVKTDEWKIDMILGGSQKCLSAPPGLTFLSVSQDAWQAILERKKPITGFYCNLSLWKNWYSEKWFPYTQAVSDIFALNEAVQRLLKESNPQERHRKISKAVRKSVEAAGLELYPLDGFSSTVTTINIPQGITFNEINQSMLEDHNILIAGAFAFLKDKVFRIGHMGENCFEDKVYLTLKALNQVFIKHSIKINAAMHEVFVKEMSK